MSNDNLDKTITLTYLERIELGSALAAFLEDFEKQLKRNKIPSESNRFFRQIEKLTYTKIIPESWCGPKPEYWDKEK